MLLLLLLLLHMARWPVLRSARAWGGGRLQHGGKALGDRGEKLTLAVVREAMQRATELIEGLCRFSRDSR